MSYPLVVPVRLQLRRTAGFRLTSPNALPIQKVDRTTQWGNSVTTTNMTVFVFCKAQGGKNFTTRNATPHEVLKRFKEEVDAGTMYRWTKGDIKKLLGGRNLACWCQLCPKHRDKGLPAHEKCADCAPCHADVLLGIANAKPKKKVQGNVRSKKGRRRVGPDAR